MTAELENANAWLSKDEMASARSHLPIVYVNLVPVRTDSTGAVTHLGLLLAPDSSGAFRHNLISGRVLFHERVRDAILRHAEKDLGPMSLPSIPAAINPFGVFEYFPTPDISGLWDERQHAIALAYVLPVSGDCQPSQQALDLAWLSVSDLTSVFLEREMPNGQHRVVLAALHEVGICL
jgi:hypothetical protein